MLDKINLTLDWALNQATQKDAYLPETVQKLLDVMDFDVPYSARAADGKAGFEIPSELPETLPGPGS